MRGLSPAGRLRTLGAVRAGVGVAWLAALATDRATAGATLPRAGRLAAGALAVRDLAQGALLVTRPEPNTAEAGAAVDTLHGLSMVPVVAFAPRYRLAASVSAVTAAAWVGCALLALHEPTVGRHAAHGAT